MTLDQIKRGTSSLPRVWERDKQERAQRRARE